MSDFTELMNEINRRNAALRDLDLAYFRARCPGAGDDVLMAVAHKARYECLAIEEEYRHESAEWLREHGLKRMLGDDLLPSGELPA